MQNVYDKRSLIEAIEHYMCGGVDPINRHYLIARAQELNLVEVLPIGWSDRYIRRYRQDVI